MKTSDEIKNRICELSENRIDVYANNIEADIKIVQLQKILPKVESLENDLEYYKHGVEELRKENEAMKKNIILVLEILSGDKNEGKIL